MYMPGDPACYIAQYITENDEIVHICSLFIIMINKPIVDCGLFRAYALPQSCNHMILACSNTFMVLYRLLYF